MISFSHKNPNQPKYRTLSVIASGIKRGKTVLDVGCGRGFLIEALSGKECSLFGVDVNGEFLAQAKKKGYQKVWRLDLNKNFRRMPKNKFDFLIFADALEHLYRPEEVLKYFLTHHLTKNGRILVSVPNIANFRIRAGLLLGNFDRKESGIMDQSHVHFYTRKSIVEMVSRLGLKIDKVLFSGDKLGFLANLHPLLGELFGYSIVLFLSKDHCEK